MSLRNIGLLYRDTGKKERAKEYLQESYRLFIQLNLKPEAEEVKELLEDITAFPLD
ncbi:MAG: hypothetical protein QME42_11205 [bacterium]|nr:hypothetical protein [bacterium]